MYKLLLLGLMASAAMATDRSHMLLGRQASVPCSDLGQKDCGSGCIDLTWTCCPDQMGGCPPTAYCSLGTNNEYGCCPNGESCGGPGGATTSSSIISETVSQNSISTSTSTSTVAPVSISTSTETSVSSPGLTSTSTSSSTSIVYTSSTPTIVPSTTTSSNYSVTTTSLATFTGAASESYRISSLVHALGIVLTTLLMLY